MDKIAAVAALHGGAIRDDTGIAAQPQGASLVDVLALAGHEINDLMGALFVELAGVCIGHPGHIPGVLNDGNLHTKANSEEGQIVGPGVVCGGNHTCNAPVTEAAGNDDAVQSGKLHGYAFRGNALGINPVNVNVRIQGVACVAHSLGYGQVSVMKLHILAHQANLYMVCAAFDALHHLGPFAQVRFGGIDVQFTADHAGEIGFFQHQRGLVQTGQGDVLDNAVGLHIAEHGNLFENGLLQRLIAAQDDDVRSDAHALQFLYGVLGGLGLMLVGTTQERDQGYMNKQAVFMTNLQGDLSDGFQEGLGFNVANGAANFCDDHVRIGLLAHPVDEVFDLVGHMGDDLNRGAKVFAPAFFVQHVPVDLTGGQVGVFVQILVNEPLIVTQVQVRFRTVLGDVDLTMLVGTHGARVHINVGVQLLCGYFQASGLQQTAQRGGRNALAKTGDHAAGHKNILRHISESSL